MPPHGECLEVGAEGLRVCGRERDLLEVEAGAERVLAFAGQHDRPDVVTLLAAAQGIERLLHAEQIHGIRHLRQVEGQGRDAVGCDLEADVLVRGVCQDES